MRSSSISIVLIAPPLTAGRPPSPGGRQIASGDARSGVFDAGDLPDGGGFGLVRAERPGPHRVGEVASERRVDLLDAGDRVPDAGGPRLARPLQRVGRLPGPPAEPE